MVLGNNVLLVYAYGVTALVSNAAGADIAASTWRGHQINDTVSRGTGRQGTCASGEGEVVG